MFTVMPNKYNVNTDPNMVSLIKMKSDWNIVKLSDGNTFNFGYLFLTHLV